MRIQGHESILPVDVDDPAGILDSSGGSGLIDTNMHLSTYKSGLGRTDRRMSFTFMQLTAHLWSCIKGNRLTVVDI